MDFRDSALWGHLPEPREPIPFFPPLAHNSNGFRKPFSKETYKSIVWSLVVAVFLL